MLPPRAPHMRDWLLIQNRKRNVWRLPSLSITCSTVPFWLSTFGKCASAIVCGVAGGGVCTCEKRHHVAASCMHCN